MHVGGLHPESGDDWHDERVRDGPLDLGLPSKTHALEQKGVGSLAAAINFDTVTRLCETEKKMAFFRDTTVVPVTVLRCVSGPPCACATR